VSVMGQISGLLKHYTGGSTWLPSNVNEHFDNVAQAAPQSSIADGIAAAFRSDQTPAFGQVLGGLFAQSIGKQKAGFLGPGALAHLGGRGALARLLGAGAKAITLEQAQQVSPEIFPQLAAHLEKTDPSIIDKASDFYAQHSTQVKTLRGYALSTAIANLAQRHSQREVCRAKRNHV
jgi:hypothetical protein